MGVDLGEVKSIFSLSSALRFLCNRDKLRDNFEHNSNAYYYYS